MAATQPRYREIAERLERSLRGGVYAPGQRLPSVRALGQSWDASITTVVAAYHLLEQRGLVESRAQSGHFAANLQAPAAVLPQPLAPTDVGLGQLALEVLRAGLDPQLVPFGPALADPELLPKRELDRILAAVAREGASGCDRYGVPPGLLSLRSALARRAATFGCAVETGQLVVTAGALEALTLALRATCRAGQTVAIAAPMYYGLLQSIEALGLRVIEIPVDPRGGLSLETLREALDEHAIAAVVAMPTGGNPLGCRSPEAAVRELVELLAEREVPLIEDDVWGDLAHAGDRPRPAKSWDRDGLVLWCSSLSKTAAPGLRIGWIAAGRWQAQVEHLQFTDAVGPSPLTQEIAARFLAGGAFERALRRARTAYAERCTSMADAVLAAFPQPTRIVRPEVGFCLWVELPPGTDGQAVHAAALAQGISTTPGRLFSAKQRYRHFLRLSAARWDAQSPAAIQRLARIVEKSTVIDKSARALPVARR